MTNSLRQFFLLFGCMYMVYGDWHKLKVFCDQNISWKCIFEVVQTSKREVRGDESSSAEVYDDLIRARRALGKTRKGRKFPWNWKPLTIKGNSLRLFISKPHRSNYLDLLSSFYFQYFFIDFSSSDDSTLWIIMRDIWNSDIPKSFNNWQPELLLVALRQKIIDPHFFAALFAFSFN